MRLFLDANVLFSAAYSPTGRSAALIRLARSGRCRVVTSRYAADEARRNLAVKSPRGLQRFADTLEGVEMVADAGPRSVARALRLGLPAGDAAILAAAVTAGADGLVTGDRRHFGHLFGKTVGGVRVLSLRGALNEVLRSD